MRVDLARVPAFVAGAGLVVVLAACSSSGSGAQSHPTTTPPTTHSAPTSSAPTSSAPTSSAAASTSSPAAPAAAAPKITIKDFGYGPPDKVSPGAKVMVKNNDQVGHTVTADASGHLFDVTVDPGSTATFTAPDKPGRYKFHCTFHSNMHGTLVVA